MLIRTSAFYHELHESKQEFDAVARWQSGLESAGSCKWRYPAVFQVLPHDPVELGIRFGAWHYGPGRFAPAAVLQRERERAGEIAEGPPHLRQLEHLPQRSDLLLEALGFGIVVTRECGL